MAIDYNDPVVMEEFNAIQSMEYDDVVEELSQSGVRAPADMGDMVSCFVCVSFLQYLSFVHIHLIYMF